MPKNQRRLIIAAFSASILTLLSAIIVCIFWYGRMDLGPDVVILRLMIPHIESTTALIVCNTVVVTMFFYRIFHRIYDLEAPEPREKVDLNQPSAFPPPESQNVGDENKTERQETRPNSSRPINSSIVTPMTFTQIEDSVYENSLGGSELDGKEGRNVVIDSPVAPGTLSGTLEYPR